jgi:hypothetical protein
VLPEDDPPPPAPPPLDVLLDVDEKDPPSPSPLVELDVPAPPTLADELDEAAAGSPPAPVVLLEALLEVLDGGTGTGGKWTSSVEPQANGAAARTPTITSANDLIFISSSFDAAIYASVSPIRVLYGVRRSPTARRFASSPRRS